MKYTREQIEQWLDEGDCGPSHLEDIIRQLLAKNDALRRDASRWAAATRDMELNDVAVVVYDTHGDSRVVTGEDADAAIDAARAKQCD